MNVNPENHGSQYQPGPHQPGPYQPFATYNRAESTFASDKYSDRRLLQRYKSSPFSTSFLLKSCAFSFPGVSSTSSWPPFTATFRSPAKTSASPLNTRTLSLRASKSYKPFFKSRVLAPCWLMLMLFCG